VVLIGISEVQKSRGAELPQIRRLNPSVSVLTRRINECMHPKLVPEEKGCRNIAKNL
jgi:hypothetical protein